MMTKTFPAEPAGSALANIARLTKLENTKTLTSQHHGAPRTISSGVPVRRPGVFVAILKSKV